MTGIYRNTDPFANAFGALGGLGLLGQAGNQQSGWIQVALQEQHQAMMQQMQMERANADIWRGTSTGIKGRGSPDEPWRGDEKKTAHEELQAEVNEWLPDL